MKTYLEYKKTGITAIPQIPKHWDIAYLRWITTFVETGKTPPTDQKKYYEKADFNWFGPADFTDNLFLQDSIKKINYVAIEDGKAPYYDEETVLIEGIGTIGKIGILKKPGSCNQQINAISYNKRINPYYGAYYLSSIKEIIFSLANFTTLPILNQSQTKNIPHLIPPYNEQLEIVNFIQQKDSSNQQVINNQKEMMILLAEYRSALINQVVTKGLDPNVPVKDSGIEWLGEIPSHWSLKKLKYVSNINFSNVDKHTYENEIPIRLCNYNDVYKNDFITPNMDFMIASGTNEEISKFTLKKDQVLITKDSESWEDIAVPAYVKDSIDRVICGYHLAQIQPHSINGLFLFYLFSSNSINYQYKVGSHGITRYGLGKYELENSLVLIPPVEEQEKISIFLHYKTTTIDNLIKEIKNGIDLLFEFRNSLISDVVSGKLDIRASD